MAQESSKPVQWLAVAGAVVAMLVGPLLWIGCLKWFGTPYIAGTLIGLMIGLAVKLTAKVPDKRLALAAIVMTVLAAWAGFVWADQVFVPWKPQFVPSVAESAGRFFKDLSALIFTALGAWFAYGLAKRPSGE